LLPEGAYQGGPEEPGAAGDQCLHEQYVSATWRPAGNEGRG
jgi:hypothetical protein